MMGTNDWWLLHSHRHDNSLKNKQFWSFSKLCRDGKDWKLSSSCALGCWMAMYLKSPWQRVMFCLNAWKSSQSYDFGRNQRNIANIVFHLHKITVIYEKSWRHDIFCCFFRTPPHPLKSSYLQMGLLSVPTVVYIMWTLAIVVAFEYCMKLLFYVFKHPVELFSMKS